MGALTHIRAALVIGMAASIAAPSVGADSQLPADMGVTYVDIAKAAGITARTIFGDERKNRFLFETTGCGAAFFDYDGDGLLDVFLVNGTRVDGIAASEAPINHLYRNRGDGTFEDVTAKAGVGGKGWGQGVCVGDYDNDGHDDIFVSYYGTNLLYHNNGDGTFGEVGAKAGVATNRTRWGSGCAFLDYDRDGLLDLFVASYIDLDPKTAPLPETGPCLYKGLLVACGPPGLIGGKNTLYRNNGDGTFSDVTAKAQIDKTDGTYGLGVLVSDFDNDDWPDIYVANDSAPATLYRNNKNGTFTDIALEAGCAYSIDGKPQAGMGVTAGDYDRDGRLDIFKTNFAGDTSTLFHNTGAAVFDDATFPAGIGINTRWLGWGCGFVDVDNDGWLDIFLVNGHVYPEVEKLTTEAGYAQRKIVYRNLRNGRFEDVTDKIGGATMVPTPSRGCAFGDFDNDGDVDVIVNPVNAVPELLRAESSNQNSWVAVRTIGVKSNRNGIGARVTCVDGDGVRQFDDVRSGGSYYSQNDMRVHFGLGKAKRVKTLEVRWPSGQVDVLHDLSVNRYVVVKEGSSPSPAAAAPATAK